VQLLQVLLGLGSPSHLIFLRRHVSQATTTRRRFFALGSEGLGASSGLTLVDLEAADVVEPDLAFLPFFCGATVAAALGGEHAELNEVDAKAKALLL